MDVSPSLIINIRCHNSLAKRLKSHLDECGWQTESLKPFSAKNRLLEVIITPESEFISPLEQGNLFDESLIALQDAVDFFLKEEKTTHEFHPEWQIRRGGVNGYADWEQETSMEDLGAASSLLKKSGISLVAGWAFGNGSHPATIGCTEAIEHLHKQGMLTDRTVLDIGTGTGILSLLAARFGASEIIALDIDPESANIARLNVQENGLDNRISIFECSLSDITPFSADIITANLTPSVMNGNISQMTRFMGGKTTVVAGGFKRGKLGNMNDMFNTAGCRPDWSTDISGWLTVIYKQN